MSKLFVRALHSRRGSTTKMPRSGLSVPCCVTLEVMQGTPRKIRPEMSLIRKRHDFTDGVKDFRYHSIGCIRVVPCNVLANLIEICESVWVKCVPAHPMRLR